MNIDDIINKLPDKSNDYSTTSHKFKRELYQFCIDNDLKTGCELGSCMGYTTRIMANCLNKVYSVDVNFEKNKTLNRDLDNIIYIKHNLYGPKALEILDNIDICLIDANHDYQYVLKDIKTAIGLGSQYLVFDDYGLFKGVRRAVDESFDNLKWRLIDHIGMPPKHNFGGGRMLLHHEGVIAQCR